MKEIWKDIPEFEGYYQASSLGKIKSMKRIYKCGHNNKQINHTIEKILKPGTNHKGYYFVVLQKNGFKKSMTIHRIIAKVFIKNTKNKPCVNHINCNKKDNRVGNLEWVTYLENTRHAWDNGLIPILKGKLSPSYGRIGELNYKSIKVIDISTNIIYESIRQAEIKTGEKYLHRKLNGTRKNNTNFRYVQNIS